MPNMPKNSALAQRKSDHINIVLNKDVSSGPNSLQTLRLPWKALPEVDLAKIDTSCKFWGKRLQFPFIISSMTGGTLRAATINKNLAIAAERSSVAVGLGSSRVVLREPAALKSFQVKKYCPNVPLFANFGLVQLNYGIGAEEINKVVDLLEVDGIFLHINHLQEAIQPEGDTNFAGLVEKLKRLIPQLKVPVIVKEVGAGFDFESAKLISAAGVEWLDVSGLGGTSWTKVEAHRREDDLGHIFGQEGMTTVESLLECRRVKGLNLIAGGGIRTGIDICKSLILGAKLATAATPLLKTALVSVDDTVAALNQLQSELQLAMFCVGAAKISALQKLSLK